MTTPNRLQRLKKDQGWGLPPDYPMVASTYSTARSKFAKAAALAICGMRCRVVCQLEFDALELALASA